MIDNNIENKLRKFNEDLRLNLNVKYLGKRKEPVTGCVEYVFLAVLIRPESQSPYFVETLSTLVYVGRIKRPSLTSIFCSLLSTRLPYLEEHNSKRIQALRAFFTQSEIDYLHELVFQVGAEWQEFSNR